MSNGVLNDCYGQEAAAWDKRLNIAYGKTSSGMEKDALENLRKVQRAWLAWRDDTCKQSYLVFQGTMAGPMGIVVLAGPRRPAGDLDGRLAHEVGPAQRFRGRAPSCRQLARDLYEEKHVQDEAHDRERRRKRKHPPSQPKEERGNDQSQEYEAERDDCHELHAVAHWIGVHGDQPEGIEPIGRLRGGEGEYEIARNSGRSSHCDRSPRPPVRLPRPTSRCVRPGGPWAPIRRATRQLDDAGVGQGAAV